MDSSSQSQPVFALRGAITSTEYECRNALGTLLYTSPDLKLARAWLSERASQWPGAQVNEVVTTTSTRRVFKPVAYLRRVV